MSATFQPDRLKRAQRAQELTNEELAREIGVSLRLLQRWRSGKGAPSGGNLVALGIALERPAGWFYEEGVIA